MRDESGLLAALAGRPDDEVGWLAYADWLEEQGGERCRFVRLLLELARGVEDEERQVDVGRRFHGLGDGDVEWRAEVVRLRSGLPLRFRVTEHHVQRSSGEMFDRSMTWLAGFIEQGTVRAGQRLLVRRRDAAPVEAGGVMVASFKENFTSRSAGQPPFLIALVWMGCREELGLWPCLVEGC